MKLWERSSPKKGATKPMGHPTPIRISKRTAIVAGLAILATVVLVLWAVPSVLISVVGGFGLALVLSFPVRTLSRWMPRGIAIRSSQNSPSTHLARIIHERSGWLRFARGKADEDPSKAAKSPHIDSDRSKSRSPYSSTKLGFVNNPG
jgi:hypothetical protein